jgi:hypothetical protein
MTALHRTWVTFVALACLAAAGCGKGNDGRSSVTGDVTFDGEPLESGVVTLIPGPGTKSPSAGAEIVNGKFTIPESGGPQPGSFRVEITASRKTGEQRDEGGMVGMIDVTEQYIPERYNKASELTVDVDPGANKLEFELTSN